MAYTVYDFDSKKSLKEAFKKAGPGKIKVYQPGPFGPKITDGSVSIEGPHYPRPHKWYARVIVQNQKIEKIVN